MRELGRDPTIDEIARRVRLSKERVKELMGYMAQRVISLDDPVDIAEGLDADEVPSFSEYLADDPSSNPEEIVINREFKEAIEEAIRELPDRTQQALKLRFGLEDNVIHTYDEIGYQLGLSRQRAMQLVQVGLQQLREHPKIKMLMASKD
jgi:RNA polymerase primary sigma factor